MNMKRTTCLIVTVALILAAPAFAAETAAKQPPQQAQPVPGTGARLIRPGDVLKISVWKYSDMNASLAVGPEGYVSYSFVGDIPVVGKTTEDVRRVITDKLNQQYIANPQVDVQLEAQQLVVFVVGEVVRPGSYPYQPGLDPLKAIALAGGFTDFASRKASIIRKDPATGKDTEIKANLKKLMKADQNREAYSIQPGDMVVVKRSWF